MKVVNIGNIAEAYICDELPAMGVVIEATLDELERLPNLIYKEVTISATPRRNCDVGTAEEQSQRFDAFCDEHKYVGDDGANWCSRTCPCYNDINCGVKWAQMPCEEGGAK